MPCNNSTDASKPHYEICIGINQMNLKLHPSPLGIQNDGSLDESQSLLSKPFALSFSLVQVDILGSTYASVIIIVIIWRRLDENHDQIDIITSERIMKYYQPSNQIKRSSCQRYDFINPQSDIKSQIKQSIQLSFSTITVSPIYTTVIRERTCLEDDHPPNNQNMLYQIANTTSTKHSVHLFTLFLRQPSEWAIQRNNFVILPITTKINAFHKIYYKSMMTSHPHQMQEWSSDEDPAPFVGKYHAVLRRRNKAEVQVIKPKKEYKQKKFQYKNLINIYQYWKLQLPLSQQHIYNFHNILAINEQSMINPDYDQSFISTKFYMKKVKKVNIHCNALLFTLEDMERACTPISYICQRFKSMGDSMFMKMAETLQHLEETLPQISRKLHKEQQIDQNELEAFLKEMHSKLFFSQYSPHLLIISNSLIEMLGFDIEEFAIEAIKHKSILYEFFSAQNYAKVIYKHLENIEMLRQYLEGSIGLQQFCKRSLMVYNDTVFNRKNQKIQCQFYAGTSKQLTPYIEIKNMDCNSQEVRKLTPEMEQRMKKVEQFKQLHHCREYDLLKKLIKLPEQMDPRSKDKMCRYQILNSPMIEELSSNQEEQ